MIGTSDKSSGAKSTSTPSTPQAESGDNVGSRLSHSLPAESSPSADLISEAIEDKDIHEDSLLGQETPLVCKYAMDLCFLFLLLQLWTNMPISRICKMSYSPHL